MRPTEIQLLDHSGNVAVAHLPGRMFPAVCVQGDTLSTLRAQLAKTARDLRASPGDIEALDELDDGVARLDEMLAYYERVLADRGMSLPYLP